MKMAKKLSIIRFKPKPEHYDAFLNDVIENGKDRDPEFPHFCAKAGDEVIAVVVRDADNYVKVLKLGQKWQSLWRRRLVQKAPR